MNTIENPKALIYHFIRQRILEARLLLEDGGDVGSIRLRLIDQLKGIDSSEKIIDYLRGNPWRNKEDINAFDKFYEETRRC